MIRFTTVNGSRYEWDGTALTRLSERPLVSRFAPHAIIAGVPAVAVIAPELGSRPLFELQGDPWGVLHPGVIVELVEE